MLVVLKRYRLPLDAFMLVFFLFKCEHVLIELLLQFFVGIIDAQLFEGVLLEDFESKDIKQTDEGQVALTRCRRFLDLFL